MTGLSRARKRLLVILSVVAFSASVTRTASAADQIYFAAVDNVTNVLVNLINQENTRLDIGIWLLSEGAVSIAIANCKNRGVPVRVIGDRVAIFESDAHTKDNFYYLANEGVPIRLRYNPTWYPEINHWKAAIFVGQKKVLFGSGNFAPTELAPVSSTNYDDESHMVVDASGSVPDPVSQALFGAFLTKFDVMWNDTTNEPSQFVPAPYLKNWDDACALESACADFRTRYPNAPRLQPDTRRLVGDNASPPEMVWGQGSEFNGRLVEEINKETDHIDLIEYRLTVPEISEALLARFQRGVKVRLIVDTFQYANPLWPEYELTHAYVDQLYAAGVPIRQRVHQGITHMKTLITSQYATNASSNYAASWQRDHNYFVSATSKRTIYQAFVDRFNAMWTDNVGFTTFSPQPPFSAVLASPSSGSGNISTTPTLTWNRASFATSYDVYLDTSPSPTTLVANVAADVNGAPRPTYSWTAASALVPGTTYYWKVVSRTFATPVNPAMVASSEIRSFTTTATGPPPSPLPSPWATQDVGVTGLAGSASYSSGTFTVSGAGADVWGTSDSFRFVYQALSSDGQIVARVLNVQNTNTFAKAGVMIRSSLAENAAHAILDVRPNGVIEWMTRSSTGGSTTPLGSATQGTPVWLRLSRSGTTVTAAYSTNGSSWTTVGSTTLGSSAYVGLVVCSHDTSALNTSSFDNVTVTTSGPPPPPSLPSPWVNQDVGSVGLAGSASHSSGTFTVSGAGADVWGTADSFQFVYQPLNGDGQIVARVVSTQNTNTFAKAGIMIRSSLAENAAHAILDIRPNGVVEWMTRSTTGGATTSLGSATQAVPVWLQLTRSGSTITAAYSINGTAWTPIGSTTLGGSAYVGLIVCSHNTGVLNTSTFDSVTVGSGSPPPPSLPTPWVNQDIGAVGLSGSASYSSGTFTVSGAGADVWGTADSFQFVYQPLNGDGQITARVVSTQNTNTFAKAGIMIRSSRADNAAHAILDVRPNGVIEWMTRSTTGGATTPLGSATHAAPVWLRLTRSGSTITAAYSTNGASWSQIGSTTLGGSAYVGLIVCSHDTGALNTSTFDNVAVGAGGAP